MEKIRLLAVVGATASGKSALAVELARRLDGEIVSCDSMQVYRGMDIGTAKPTKEEMGGVAHHLIDVADPSEPFSVASYVELARRAIEEIAERGRLPILCGGTGLYLDALLRGGFAETQGDPALREELFAFAKERGAHALHERLRTVDPQSAEAIHENNIKRVVRALEIYESTGMTKTEADRRSLESECPFAATVMGLWYPERELLYERIADRVDRMLDDGLAAEAERLWKEGIFERNSTAAQAIGYKELLPYLRGEGTLPAAAERLVLATRHYAKRQITWFRARSYVTWVNMTDGNGRMRSMSDIAEEMIRIQSV